jgi:hypothetical protein
MINLNGLFLYYVTLILTMTCAILTGLAIGAASSSPQMAQALAPTVMILLILVSGLYTNRDTIPAALSWLQYVSFVAYAYSILVVNEFHGQRYTCTGPVCYRTGQEVIVFFGMDQPSMGLNFVGLVSLTIGSALIGMIMLSYSVRKQL